MSGHFYIFLYHLQFHIRWQTNQPQIWTTINQSVLWIVSVLWGLYTRPCPGILSQSQYKCEGWSDSNWYITLPIQRAIYQCSLWWFAVCLVNLYVDVDISSFKSENHIFFVNRGTRRHISAVAEVPNIAAWHLRHQTWPSFSRSTLRNGTILRRIPIYHHL